METAKLYEIDRLSDCDANNLAESRRVLLALHRESLNAVDDCAKLLEHVGVLFGQTCKYDKYQQQLDEWLKTQSGEPAQHVKFLEQATLIGKREGHDVIANAKRALESGNAVIARTYLVLRLGRDFLFGLSDLLRLRLTSMLGYLRIQVETAAILTLISSDSAMAVDWLNTADLKRGTEFYKKHHQRIIKKLKELSLHRYYEQGSSMALHSRVLGVASGIMIGKQIGSPGTVRLTYQEIDDHVILLLWFCVYLRAHKEIIDALPQALPELDFDQIEVWRFEQLVESLWATLRPLYKAKRQKRSGVA